MDFVKNVNKIVMPAKMFKQSLILFRLSLIIIIFLFKLKRIKNIQNYVINQQKVKQMKI